MKSFVTLCHSTIIINTPDEQINAPEYLLRQKPSLTLLKTKIEILAQLYTVLP